MSTILIVEARFYPHLNDMLLAGARAAIEAAGHKHETANRTRRARIARRHRRLPRAAAASAPSSRSAS